MNDTTKSRFVLKGTVGDSNNTSKTLELVGWCASLRRSSTGRDLMLCRDQHVYWMYHEHLLLTCRLRVGCEAHSVGEEIVWEWRPELWVLKDHSRFLEFLSCHAPRWSPNRAFVIAQVQRTTDIAVKRVFDVVPVIRWLNHTGSGFKIITHGTNKLQSSAVINSRAAHIAYWWQINTGYNGTCVIAHLAYFLFTTTQYCCSVNHDAQNTRPGWLCVTMNKDSGGMTQGLSLTNNFSPCIFELLASQFKLAWIYSLHCSSHYKIRNWVVW